MCVCVCVCVVVVVGGDGERKYGDCGGWRRKKWMPHS